MTALPTHYLSRDPLAIAENEVHVLRRKLLALKKLLAKLEANGPDLAHVSPADRGALTKRAMVKVTELNVALEAAEAESERLYQAKLQSSIAPEARAQMRILRGG